MAITFPNSPSSGDTHTTSNGLQYTYDGEKWTTIGTNSAGTWTRTGTTVSLTTAGDDLNVDSGTLFADASTNNVGIGTTSPANNLDIAVGSNNEGIRISSSTNVFGKIDFHANRSGTDAALGILDFNWNNTQVARIIGGTGTDTTNKDDGVLQFHTAAAGSASEAMRIDSSGRLLLDTTTPGEDFADELTIANNSHCGITIRSSSSTTGNLYFSDGTSGTAQYSGAIVYDHGSDSLELYTNGGQERVRITSSGNLGIGTSSPRGKLEVSDGTSNTAGEAINEAYIVGATTGSSEGILTIQSNNGMASNKGGSIAFGGRAVTGSSAGANWAFINGYKENGTTANYGGYLSFATRPNSGAISERLRIDSSGRVLIGSSAVQAHPNMDDLQLGDGSGNRGLTISSGTSGYGTLAFGDSADSSGNDRYSGSIEYYHADNSMRFYADIGERMRINSSGNVGIGTTSPDANVDIRGTNPSVLFSNSNKSKAYRIQLNESADALVINDNDLNERMRIGSTGTIQTYAQSSTDSIFLGNSSSAGTSILLIGGRHSSTNTTSGTVSFKVFTNGNVQNTNDSYGQISDIKLKENIVDAGSQWDDFKAVRFRKYNFKEETGHETFTQLGVIAQELELTSPGLVYETADQDEDGNDLGTTTKAVKSSILTKKALVALQEAMERIETLEQRLSDAGIA